MEEEVALIPSRRQLRRRDTITPNRFVIPPFGKRIEESG
jgi:hypothetical protein